MRAMYHLLLNLCFTVMVLGICSLSAHAQQVTGFPGSAANAVNGQGVQDMKLGSVLFFNYYNSDPNNPTQVDTYINITNVDQANDVALHIFLVDTLSCNIADAFVCLTRNQTMTFLASDMDPGIVGYMIAIAVDSLGRPVSFNALAGDALIGTPTGHRFLLPAVVAARKDATQGLTASPINSDGITSTLFFNGAQYDLLPQTLILDSFPSQTVGVGAPAGNTVLYVYSPPPDLSVFDGSGGTLFFLVHDDQEQSFSGNLTLGCFLPSAKQRIASVRTIPNINTIVPSGHTGWASFYGVGSRTVTSNTNGGTVTLDSFPLMGATATRLGSFNGGHNLRMATTYPAYSITIPVILPPCATIDANRVTPLGSTIVR